MKMSSSKPPTEKNKVLFRKHHYGIIALFPEVPFDNYNADSCVSYVYFDTPIFYREAADRYLGYPRPRFEKNEANIEYTLNITTKAEPDEYNKLKNLLESDGFSIEVKDEIDEEMDLTRHNKVLMNKFAEYSGKENNDNIVPNAQKEDFWKFKKEDFWVNLIIGFIVVVIGFLLIVLHPLGGFILSWGIIVSVVLLCYYVGKWFLPRK
jgi:hypothetical protein